MYRQRPPRSAAQRVAFAIVAVLTVALGYYLGNRIGGSGVQVPSSPEELIAAGEPVDLADLTLIDYYGQPFGGEQFAGRWSLLAFTHPDDVEQTRKALTRLVLVHNRLVDHPKLQKAFRGLVVALDPLGDPTALRELLDIDSPDFIGLSVEPERLARLAPEGGRDAPAEALAEALALVDPQRRLVGWFAPDVTPAAVAADLKSLARAASAH